MDTMTEQEIADNPLPTISELRADDWGDKKRVRVYITIADMTVQPNIELSIFTDGGDLSAYTNIVEAMVPRVVVTQHLRVLSECARYTVRAAISIQDQPAHQVAETDIQL